MYQVIESEYRNLDPEKKFDKAYWIFSVGVCIIMEMLTYFIKNSIVLIILTFVTIFIFLVLYSIRNSKTYLKKEDLNNSFIKKIQLYFTRMEEHKINNLIKLLKENNVNTKDKIKLIINHYEKRIPMTKEADVWNSVINIGIAMIPVVMIGYSEESGLIDLQKIIIVVQQVLPIILAILTVIFVINLIIGLPRKSKLGICIDLTESLTKIYMNFEKYKNIFKN